MTLRHCFRCGPEVRHSALLMHRLDGLQSAYDRVVWLCGLHWAEAQKSPVLVGEAAGDDSTPIMVLASPALVAQILEDVAA